MNLNNSQKTMLKNKNEEMQNILNNTHAMLVQNSFLVD